MVAIEKIPPNFTVQQAQQVSTLFALLPSVLQDCLPRFSSLRHSIYGVRHPDVSMSQTSVSGSGYRSKMPRTSLEVIDASHKDFGYTEVCSEDEDEESDINDGGDDEVNDYFEKIREKEVRYRQQIQTNRSVRESGVNWRCAQQGLNLLNLAIAESSSPITTNVPADRQFYLHSLTYLIRALPIDLSEDEQNSLHAVLPNTMAKFDHPKVLPPSYQQSSRSAVKRASASLLHRILASTIVQLFLIFQFLLPHIRFLLAKAWAYEKEHQVMIKTIRKGVEFGMSVGEVIRGMGEGRVGDVVAGSIEWFLLGIVGGIEEALAIIGSLNRREGIGFSNMK